MSSIHGGSQNLANSQNSELGGGDPFTWPLRRENSTPDAGATWGIGGAASTYGWGYATRTPGAM
eukprot:5887538-Pyramimonas_sp.AAC.1